MVRYLLGIYKGIDRGTNGGVDRRMIGEMIRGIIRGQTNGRKGISINDGGRGSVIRDEYPGPISGTGAGGTAVRRVVRAC